jgi:flagellar biosynthesis protein FlhB
MAADKPFDPTPTRLARAKRDGDLALSQSVNVAASLAVASLALFAALGSLADAAAAAFEGAAGGHATPGAYVAIGAAALGVPCSGLAGAALSTYLQAGRFTLRFPALKLARLDPAAGIKRLLSRDAVVGGAKAAVVAAAVAAAAAPAVVDSFAPGAGVSSGSELAALVISAIARILCTSLAAAGAFALLDILVERNKWRRRLRMSFDELKREHRANEGDPLLRGRRRRTHRALVRGSIGRLKEAAFVVCNPSHVAIALAYRPPEIAVPQVLVRAIDEGAREVKRRARSLGIPLVEDIALARTLLAATECGDYIPAAVYGAVAAIVAQLAREMANA